MSRSIWDHGAANNLNGYSFEKEWGWNALLEELNLELEAIDPDYEWVQIKQKFCELRVYLGKHSRALCGCAGYHDCRMEQAIGRASEKSMTICEWCGGEADPQSSGMVCCTECDIKKKAERMLQSIKNITRI